MAQLARGVATQAKLFRGLADPARLGLVSALRQGPTSAGELARTCGLTPSRASNHLQCLLECGLVAVEARGRQNVYALADPLVAGLLDLADGVVSGPAGSLIDACRNYGPPSRRKLRPAAVDSAVADGARTPRFAGAGRS